MSEVDLTIPSRFATQVIKGHISTLSIRHALVLLGAPEVEWSVKDGRRKNVDIISVN